MPPNPLQHWPFVKLLTLFVPLGIVMGLVFGSIMAGVFDSTGPHDVSKGVGLGVVIAVALGLGGPIAAKLGYDGR